MGIQRYCSRYSLGGKWAFRDTVVDTAWMVIEHLEIL